MTARLRRSGGSLARWLAAGVLGLATASLLPAPNAAPAGTMHLLAVGAAAFVWKAVIDRSLERFRRP